MTEPTDQQLETLTRGIVDYHVADDLKERLSSGRPLRVKAGFDPTRPDLHLGHTVLMEKMRQFQDLGHTVIFLIGDYTAMVGDPTGRNKLRPQLTMDEVKSAAATYQDQAFKVLDRDKTEVRYNSEWLSKIDFFDFIKLGAQYTVARMLERDDFRKRFAEQRPIHTHELMYPLLQGYDSVALDCDIELGGTDQLFNLMVGRDIMPRYDKREQIVMTVPLLEGTDAKVVDGRVVGPKMSKSADNYVGINEPAFDMVQKLMLVDDGVIWRYLELLSRQSNREIKALRDEVDAGGSVIAVKEAFAREIAERYHPNNEVDEAFARRRKVARGGIPDDVATCEIPVGDNGKVGLAKALQLAQMAKSTSEAFRLLKGGAVYLDGVKATNERLALEAGARHLVRIGSKNRRFVNLVVVGPENGG